MLNSIVRFVILSVIIIVVMHSLYSFLVKNLTIPRVKDLVHKPQTQYENILRSITENDKKKNMGEMETNKRGGDYDSNSADATTSSSKLSDNQIEMKNELKSYIKDLKSSRAPKQQGSQNEVSSVFDNYDSFNEYQTPATIDQSSFMEPLSSSSSSGGNYDTMLSMSQY